LRTGSRRIVLPEVGLEQRQYGLKDGQARRARSLTACLKSVGKVGIDERKENDSGRILDLGNNSIQLGRSAHQRIDMFDRSDPLILRGSGPRGRDQRFAGRVRNQVKMEVAASQRGPQRSIMNAYNQRDGLWTGVQNWTAQPWIRATARRAAFEDSQPRRLGEVQRRGEDRYELRG
jgi:hypothetical protein